MAGGWPLAAVIAFQPYCAECCATTRSRYPAVTTQEGLGRGVALTCWRSLLSENAVGQPEASAQCMPLWYSFHTGSASSADCAPHSPAALSSGCATAA